MDRVFHFAGNRFLAPSTAFPTWHGSFKYQGSTYNYTMVGPNPATSNKNTTIPVDIIPIKVVVDSKSYDPNTKLSTGQTAIQNTVSSPIYSSGVTFKEGGIGLGNTQYIDAFQRGNFWISVKKNKQYHVRLGTPTVLATQTVKPTGSNGGQGNPFGIEVGLVNINYLDPILTGLISSLKIPAGTLPVFMTYDVYLTEGPANLNDCCIGGYHDYTGTNTYMQFTYINNPGSGVQFSQDVGALSHETGEWYDDPFINNEPFCGGLLEVGDPLENEPNYGLYPYSLGGFTYHLQDLTNLPYFGAPKDTSIKDQVTFQGTNLGVCQNGQ